MRFPLFFCASFFALGLVACDANGGASCVLDTDCPAFGQACIEGACRAPGDLGEGGTPPMDASTPRDAGGPMDAGPMDAGPMDAAPMDAAPTDAMPTDGMVADAAPVDAMPTDGPVPVCETVAPNWDVMLVTPTVTCGGAINGTRVTIMENPTSPCMFTASSPGGTGITGTFTLAEDNMLLGMLTPGTDAEMSCSGTYTPATPSFTVICGSCVMNLSNVP